MSEGDGGAGDHREGGKEDVLASIRRIVDEEGAPGGVSARRDGVMPLTPAMRVEAGRGAPPPSTDEEPPLVLGPTMRVDGQAEDDDAEPAGELPAAEPVPLRRSPAEAPDDAAATRGRDAAAGGEPEAPAAVTRAELRELVRDAIREELSGELGVRVSTNIKLLVEREVRKAIEALEAEAEREEAQASRPDLPER